MKKISYFILSFVTLFFMQAGFALPESLKNKICLPEPPPPNIPLVLDMRNIDKLPKNFRTTSVPLKNHPQIDTRGLNDLHAVGSGQFSLLSFKHAISYIPADSILVIDLRQEPHGFLNANSISWYGKNNAANANKQAEVIEKEQASLLQNLRFKETAVIETQVGRPVEFAVHQALSEAELMHHFRIAYERLYIQDHHAPDNEEVNRFIQIINQTPNDTWVYFHCRAGKGRTTTFMLMYDMMHNAKILSFEDLLARQAALGGKDLTSLPEKKSSKYQAAIERLAFLKLFYQYAFENEDEFQTSWTDWLQSKGKLLSNNKNNRKNKNRFSLCYLDPTLPILSIR